MKNGIDALLKAIEIVGSQRRLAKELGISQQSVNEWVRKNKLVPAIHMFKVEALTNGKIKARELRPDIFAHEKK